MAKRTRMPTDLNQRAKAIVDLATRDATDTEWDELEGRSARFSVGQERIEVIEARGLAEARRGETLKARTHLERALAIASEIPNVMTRRLERSLIGIAPPTG